MSERRHIQNYTDGDETQKHWGYPDRIVPCTNDAGSCAYLDVVYHSHDIGMLYMGILWATIFGILLVWLVLRRVAQPAVGWPHAATISDHGRFHKLSRTARSFIRRHFLPDANHFLFGRTTRLQVLILAILAGYLLIWTFVGIVYDKWVTPVKKMPGVYNTRTSLGPWSDRVGVMAYALTPLSVFLSSRESLLSVLTGLPYQSLNFLHRWLGYIIFVQSALHTIGWCIVEIRLYQPQPSVGLEWIVQEYMIWGVIAMLLLTILFVLSTPWGIRRTGYEFIRKAHYVLAMIYIGACWAHWKKLECFLIPSFIIWGVDRGARLVRSAMLHYHPASADSAGFHPAMAAVTRFPDSTYGDVFRLDLENEQSCWRIGQHYYLCFTECSVWQSHPFTPLNAPVLNNGVVKHSYVLRAKSGETRKLAQIIDKKANQGDGDLSTPVILTGGYGEDLLERLSAETNILCVAGGTGITFVLPLLLNLAEQKPLHSRQIELVWVMRHSDNVNWVANEITTLNTAASAVNMKIRLFATREASSSGHKKQLSSGKDPDMTNACSSSDDVDPKERSYSQKGFSVDKIGDGELGGSRHPELHKLVGGFVESTVSGRTVVFASGPGGMITDLRQIVAGLNQPGKVWKRQSRFDIELVCDDRLEW